MQLVVEERALYREAGRAYPYLIQKSVSNTRDEWGVDVTGGFAEYRGLDSGHMGRGMTEESRDRWCSSTWIVHPNSPHKDSIILRECYANCLLYPTRSI